MIPTPLTAYDSLPPLRRRVLGGDAPSIAIKPEPGMETFHVDERIALEATLLAYGAFSPLDGFMGSEDYRRVIHEMRLSDGSVFSLPIVLPLDDADRSRIHLGRRIRLEGPNGFSAWMEPWEVFERNPLTEAAKVYQTTAEAHPGVCHVLTAPKWCLAGPVTLLSPPRLPFAEPADPLAVRQAIAAKGWRTTVAFQTRNPIHRAHEYLHKVALETLDGLLLHPLVGPTKEDDVPAGVRMEAYRVLLERYYPQDRVLLAQFPFPMRYAGPREAVFHALVRRNYGATHMIIGRDHAGVGGYYAPEAAGELVASVAAEIGVTPVLFSPVGYCKVCQSMVSDRTCPHSRKEWLSLSGTEVRAMLRRGELPPPEFTRPEVAQVLGKAYRN